MVISEKDKYIFIHIPKTAGMSMQRYFMGKSPDLKSRVDDVQIGEHLEDFHHPFARDVREHISASAWGNYFTFAFVRNPWERMVSWYSMAEQEIADTPSLRAIRAMSFDDFIRDGNFKHVGNNQIDYITDTDEQIIVNYVGRYEDLRADFSVVCSKLGFQPWIKHMNRSSHGPYRDYYTPETRDIVASRFARDIAAFGYDF